MKCDILLYQIGFNFNLRRYTEAPASSKISAAAAGAAAAAEVGTTEMTDLAAAAVASIAMNEAAAAAAGAAGVAGSAATTRLAPRKRSGTAAWSPPPWAGAYTLVHFSAELERLLRDRGCA